jgi:hypothetical protein
MKIYDGLDGLTLAEVKAEFLPVLQSMVSTKPELEEVFRRIRRPVIVVISPIVYLSPNPWHRQQFAWASLWDDAVTALVVLL